MRYSSEPLHSSSLSAKVVRLPNGLTVIHQYLPASPVVVADVWVRAGAIAEPNEWAGMAHFLEHMIFKGSERLQTGWFDELIESRGGATNAATSHDYAHFFLTAAAPYLEETLPHLADILLRPSLPEAEFEREREVVLEELRACYDDPDWIGFQALSELIYQCHPYGRSVLGYEELLRFLTPQQMRCFHQTHYQPENMTVAIVGGVEEAPALELVQSAFSNFKVRSQCPPWTVEAEPPLVEVRRQQLHLPNLELARLTLAWVGPGVECLHDAFGLDLLAAILASGRSSRLVRELREEKGLVLDIGCDFSLQRDSSLFTLSAWLEPQLLETVEAILCDRLLEVQTQPIAPAELARAQRLLCNDYTFSTETASQLAGLYGYYETLAQAELAATYPWQIQQFSAQALQQLASRYLSPEHYGVTILKPC
ncbi:MAG: insulinase family protein [Chloroflexaceae bacterium]|nr:insulinase family protein [Chloroflexaceae bacterium]